MRILLLLFAGFSSLAGGPSPPIIYVDAAATGADDGSSWVDAYTDLRLALLAATADNEVRVAQGIYRPDSGTGLRALSFGIFSDVRLLGGYAGTAQPDPDLRDPDLFVTVLSGDLQQDDLPGFLNRADNSLHVLVTVGSQAALIEGLTVRGGNANGSEPDNIGGGAMLGGANLVVRDCRFLDNRADERGGGAQILGATLIEDCDFEQNEAGSVGNSHGAGLNGSAAVLRDCRFTNNEGVATEINFGVGLAWTDIDGHAEIEDCSFTGNTAQGTGWGVGANISSSESIVTVRACTFSDNTALGATSRGGGAYSTTARTVTYDDCLIVGNTLPGADSRGGGLWAFSNGSGVDARACRFTGNHSSSFGGGVNATWLVRLRNCTVVNNSTDAVDGGGISTSNASDEGKVLLEQSIVWSNTSRGVTPDAEDQVFWIDGGGSFDVEPALAYSDIELYAGAYGGVGNLALDPLFVDLDGADDIPGTADDDVHLQAGSPCIDAGDPMLPLDPDGTIADLGAFFVDQGPPPPPVWIDVGAALAGLNGTPELTTSGEQLAGSATTIELSDALPFTLSYLVVGAVELSAPFKQGTLVPFPTILSPKATTGGGGVTLDFPWPVGVPSGFETWWQFWIQDPGGPAGWAASNAFKGTTP